MRRQTSDIRRQTHISSFRAKREIFVIRPEPRTLNPEPKTFFKNLLTQERQYGKIIPVADEAAPSERALKKISKKSFDEPLRMW